MAIIGVCEDDPAIRRILARSLERADHEVVLAHRGEEALSRFAPSARLDAIVMDIGLPDADGRDVVQALQAAGQRAPVLFLTALGGVSDRLAGFNAGGDDYVVKPFEIREVLARLDVLVRRAPEPPPETGDLRLDPAAFTVEGPTGRVTLTPTEFRMLAAILARPGEVVRRRAVVGAAWPAGAQVSDNTVDSFLRKIRTKVAATGSPLEIETVRGVGYRVP